MVSQVVRATVVLATVALRSNPACSDGLMA